MTKLFGWSAGLWLLGIVMLVFIAAHHVLAHLFTFAFLTAVVVSLPFLWRWLEQYKATAGIAAKIDAAEGSLFAKLRLHFSGSANAILLALTSAWATIGDWIHTTATAVFHLQPGDLDPFKDVTLLHQVFSNDVVPKIVAVITWIGVILHLRSTLVAANIVPVTVTVPGAPVPGAAPVAPAA